MKHHGAGDLQNAEKIYKQVLQAQPNHPVALHLLGTLAHQVGKNDIAVDLIRQALAIKPDYPEAHSNLGFALQAMGRMTDAIASYRQAIAIRPTSAEAHNNLGNALKEQGGLDDAAACYRQALTIRPDYAEAHFNLGNTLQDMGKLEDAILSYQAAVAQKPGFVEALSSLGYTLQELGRLDEAIDQYRMALTLSPGLPEVESSLGISLNMAGRRAEAIAHFDAGVELRRGTGARGRETKAFRLTTKSKMSHDIEQFEYLAARGQEPEKFCELAAAYRDVQSTITWPESDSAQIALNDEQLRRLGGTYNHLIRRVDAPEIAGSTLGPTLDVEEITNAYFDHTCGMTYFDDFLSPEALASLRRYLLESTIWFECKYSGGYLGAMLHDGLACPLLLQIADDLRTTFPDIFKHHKLRQLWAYKYDSTLTGITAHADFAAVNVNFWITPNSANLDPASGGLVVYNVEAPLEWDFKAYNTNQTRIRDYIAEHNDGEVVVPHNENRMVLFNSNLFHETDKISFKPGYENRRINVTMLFGYRGG